MANFTINSLSQGNLADTDNFIKSNNNGLLTKTSYGDLKKDILNNIVLPTTEQSENKIGIGYFNIDSTNSFTRTYGKVKTIIFKGTATARIPQWTILGQTGFNLGVDRILPIPGNAKLQLSNNDVRNIVEIQQGEEVSFYVTMVMP